jgi:hypothetical protein
MLAQTRPASVTLTGLVQPYDGTAKTVTVVTDPPGLIVQLIYDGDADAPTNTGSYTVSALVIDPLYLGLAKNTLVITPAITNAAAPDEEFYGTGSTMDFEIAYSGNVSVTSPNGGVPGIPVYIGSTAREALYVDSGDTNVLIFRYSPQCGDTGPIRVGSCISLHGAAIQDGNGYDAALQFAPPDVEGITVDTAPPTIAVSDPSSAIAGSSPVTYTITYDDPNFDASTLSASDITVNHTGSADGVVSVSGRGQIWTVTISNLTGFGTLSISVAAGTARDLAGNLSRAVDTTQSFIVDSAPTTLELHDLGNNMVRISILGAPGATYSIESADDLNAPNWQAVGNSVADNYGRGSLDLPSSGTAQFFRAVRPADSGNGPGR